MKKGIWYYEKQILMVVFMWQHDMTHNPTSNYGLRIGRLYIWKDSSWTTRAGYKVKRAWNFIYPFFTRPAIAAWYDIVTVITEIGNTMLNFLNTIKRFLFGVDQFAGSLWAFLNLYKAGMSISYATLDEMNSFHIYRFWWKNGLMRAMPDVDEVNGEYFTMHNGKTEKLP